MLSWFPPITPSAVVSPRTCQVADASASETIAASVPFFVGTLECMLLQMRRAKMKPVKVARLVVAAAGWRLQSFCCSVGNRQIFKKNGRKI